MNRIPFPEAILTGIKVKYANANDIPFLAVNTGHGALASLGGIQHGIEIWLDQLDSIAIAEDGKTATFGGGVKSGMIIDALWEAGKQTGMFISGVP